MTSGADHDKNINAASGVLRARVSEQRDKDFTLCSLFWGIFVYTSRCGFVYFCNESALVNWQSHGISSSSFYLRICCTHCSDSSNLVLDYQKVIEPCTVNLSITGLDSYVSWMTAKKKTIFTVKVYCANRGVAINYRRWLFNRFSGISSVVRRCIDKETGKEYAAKIIDIGAADANDPQQMLEATRQEINILRQVMGHAYISESHEISREQAEHHVFVIAFQLSSKMCSNLMRSFSWCSSCVVTASSSITSRRSSRYRRRRPATSCDRFSRALTTFTPATSSTETWSPRTFSSTTVWTLRSPTLALLDTSLRERSFTVSGSGDTLAFIELGQFKSLKCTWLKYLTSQSLFSDLCGTPGYLAPETLKSNMFEDASGYSKEVDM